MMRKKRRAAIAPKAVSFDVSCLSLSCDISEASHAEEAVSLSSEEESHATSIRGVIATDVCIRDTCRTAWKVALGVSALLDCVSTVIPSRVVVRGTKEFEARYPSEKANRRALGVLQLFGQRTLTSHTLLDLILWLNRNAVFFSFAFSFLWCIQAFLHARDVRIQAMRERDRQRLMNRGESIRTLDADDDLVKSGYFDGYGPWLAFYATLFLQLLFVPVGFYILLYKWFQLVTSSKISSLEAAAQLLGTSEGQDETLWSILNSTHHVIDISPSKRRFTMDSRLSVVMLFLKHAGNVLYHNIGIRCKRWLIQKGWKEGRKLGIDLVVRPRRVWRKARKTITWIRWAKYLAPLIATGNKLRENVVDLAKKYRQRRQALLAIKIRQVLWKKMTPEERRSRAARGIQSMYRGYRLRKARWALALIQCHRDELAAMRVQTMLRKMLQRARARIRQKRTELKELEARERLVVRGARRMTMSAFQRQRLYQLQEEMHKKKTRDPIDKRLLLRPNTRFAVIWKILFLVCVLIEITGLAVNPMLANHKDRATGKPLTFSTMLQSVLIPELVTNRKVCGCTSREMVDHWSLSAARPAKCQLDPWFCLPPFSIAQALYVAVMRFILEEFMVLVSIIAFLDVPIYFYTGELCSETGTLVPKGFFDRWIAPGILLQLLVNPEMESVSRTVWAFLAGGMKTGPVRVWRWAEALFYPLSTALFDLVEHRVWVPAVASANRNQIYTATIAIEEASPALLRRSSMMRRASLATGNSRRSSILLQQRRATVVQPRRSSLVGQSRKFSLFGLPKSPHEKEKML